MAEPVIKEPPMQIDGRVMSPEAFVEYLEHLTWPEPTPTRVFLHHTWRPTVESWKGKATILAMKAYYEKQLWRDERGYVHEGWTAGPHIFVAPDGIWLFSDLRYDGVGVYNNNYRTRHVEMVGDYDTQRPSGAVLEGTIAVLGMLFQALRMDPAGLAFHRDCSSKSCPGWAVQKSWIVPQMVAWMSAYRRAREEKRPSPREAISLAIKGIVKPGDARRPLAAAAGKRGLLGPVSDEFSLEIDGHTHVVQVYGEALLVPVGASGEPKSLREIEAELDNRSKVPPPDGGSAALPSR